MLLRFLSRRVDRKSAPSAKRFRPRLDGLEAREVPAVVTWEGGVSTSALDPLNWSGDALPDVGDDVFISGSTPDCSGLRGPFASLHIVNGYTGTVTLGQNNSVNEFEMTSGYLAQPTELDSVLIVRDKFTWTGGVLNSTSTHSHVLLIGVEQALIDPPDEGALVTGSTLAFQNDNGLLGSFGTFEPGTVQFNNGADLLVDELCSVEAPAATDAKPLNLTLTIASSEAIARGDVNVSGWNSQLPLRNAGGTVRIDAGKTGIFTGRIPTPQGTGPSVHQESGILSITGGGTLKATHGVTFADGFIYTRPNPQAGGSQTATIEGNVTNTKASIYINQSESGQEAIGVLKIVGNMGWSGGNYDPTVDATNANNADLLHVTGTLAISDTAGIGGPNVLNGLPQSGTTWKVIKAGGITIAAGTPTMPPGWELAQFGNPITELGIKKK